MELLLCFAQALRNKKAVITINEMACHVSGFVACIVIFILSKKA